LQDFYYMYQLFNIYRKIKPNVILQYTIKPNIYGTFASLPFKCLIINNVSGLGTVFLHNNVSSRIAKFLYRLSFRFPKKVFFQNSDDRSLFVDNSLIKQKITGLLPGSGIPLDKFTPMPFERNETFTFLMVGRLLYDKGIVEYAQASKILQEKGFKIKCMVLGKIETQKNLGVSLEMVQEWQKNNIIEYLGTSDDVASVLAKADCVVLPSYREGTPRSLLEASAMAKPLVATDVVGCKETIDNGKNGYLCEVKNAEDLAEKMLQIYNLDNEALKKMGEESRKKVENEFDEKIVIKKYLDTINAYQALLEKKKRK
jgi:glycosyltransferase involved in cell wall biosynthesis